MKPCTKCGAIKALDEFYRDKRCADGRYSACKACARAATKDWRTAAKAHVREYTVRYRLSRAGAVAAQMRAWRQANKDRLRQYWARWNPLCNATRRARARSQLCKCCKPKDFLQLYAEARQQGKHVDHIKPLSRGGLHCLRNLQLLTPAENLKKGSRWQEAA